MPNITEFKSPTGETLPIADTTARAEIGVLQQRADDTDHAMTDLDNAVKELQQSGTGGGGGGLPVVVLTTECVLNEETPLSAEECAALDAAAATNMPAVIRFTYNGMSLNFLFNLMGHESVTMYSTTFQEGIVTFMFAIANYEGAWIITAAAVPVGA